MRAFVLDAHSDAGLEVVQALGRAGVEVDVSSKRASCLAFHSRYVTRRLVQDSTLEPARFAAWVRARDAEKPYDLIVPSTEAALIGLMALDDGDPLWAKAILAPRRSIEVALDKHKTWQLARRVGVPLPDSTLIEGLDQVPPHTTYPVVLKPIRSKVAIGGRLTSLYPQIVRDDALRLELLRSWLRHTPVQQQEYVPGRGVGVELLYDRGRKAWHFAHERLHELPLTGGGSSYRRSVVASPELLRSAEVLLDALEWHGVAMVEYKLRPDGRFCLLEINPRLWGSLALAIDAGVNFPLGLLALARGGPIDPQPPIRNGYRTRNLPRDVQWLVSNLRADHRDPLLFTQPRGVSLFQLLRPLTGRESWDHFDVGDLRVAGTMLRWVARDLLRDGTGFLRNASLKRRVLESHEKRRAALTRREMPVRTLLFVCRGNICRSPFAAVQARARLPEHRCESAGFYPKTGRDSPRDFVDIAASVGVDLSQARSRRIDETMVAAADLILAMDLENYREICREFPGALAKTTLLGLFAAERHLIIEDPYGATESQVRRSLATIAASIDGLVEVLQPEAGGGRSNTRERGAAPASSPDPESAPAQGSTAR